MTKTDNGISQDTQLGVITVSSLCISTEGSTKNPWRTNRMFVEEMFDYRLPTGLIFTALNLHLSI